MTGCMLLMLMEGIRARLMSVTQRLANDHYTAERMQQQSMKNMY